jgi:hypothetical protein
VVCHSGLVAQITSQDTSWMDRLHIIPYAWSHCHSPHTTLNLFSFWVREPEASAVYCMSSPNIINKLQQGQQLMVCNAGGAFVVSPQHVSQGVHLLSMIRTWRFTTFCGCGGLLRSLNHACDLAGIVVLCSSICDSETLFAPAWLGILHTSTKRVWRISFFFLKWRKKTFMVQRMTTSISTSNA